MGFRKKEKIRALREQAMREKSLKQASQVVSVSLSSALNCLMMWFCIKFAVHRKTLIRSKLVRSLWCHTYHKITYRVLTEQGRTNVFDTEGPSVHGARCR